MSCSNYKKAKMDYKVPKDNLSLHAQNVYNRETGGRRFYEKSPFSIVEGFRFNLVFLIKIIIIVLLMMLLFNIFAPSNYEEIYLDVNATPTYSDAKYYDSIRLDIGATPTYPR